MSQERILVVGGAGFVGSHLCSLLREWDNEVFAFDNFSFAINPLLHENSSCLSSVLEHRNKLLQGVTVIRGSSINALDANNAFSIASPTRVIYLAALARAPLNDELIYDSVSFSTVGLSNIVQLCAHYEVKRLLNVSSSYVYGDFQYTPCDEEHPKNPKSVYGAVKYASEIICRALCDRLSVPHTIVRCIAIYGMGDLNGKLSHQNVLTAMQTGVLRINTASDVLSDFTYVSDACKGIALALMMDKGEGEVFNIARGEGRSGADVANIFSHSGYSILSFEKVKLSHKTPHRGSLDISKAQSLLNFQPTVNLESGLEMIIRALEAQA